MVDVFTYIMKDSPTAAASLLEEIDRSVSHLSRNPELGVVPKDERLRKLGYRIMIIRKYLVFYVVKIGYHPNSACSAWRQAIRLSFVKRHHQDLTQSAFEFNPTT